MLRLNMVEISFPGSCRAVRAGWQAGPEAWIPRLRSCEPDQITGLRASNSVVREADRPGPVRASGRAYVGKPDTDLAGRSCRQGSPGAGVLAKFLIEGVGGN